MTILVLACMWRLFNACTPYSVGKAGQVPSLPATRGEPLMQIPFVIPQHLSFAELLRSSVAPAVR